MDRARAEGVLFLAGFVLCIPAANWMIGHVGIACAPPGPCLLPVAPGLMAPSGVITVGLALVLRDLVQRRLGLFWALGAILVGAVLSLGPGPAVPLPPAAAAFFAPPALVLASAAAFLVSELADLAVYTPLQRRGLVLAVLASSLVGLVIDSVVFLQLAFGDLSFLAGQIVGKAWMLLLSLPVIHWLRRRDERLGIAPA